MINDRHSRLDNTHSPLADVDKATARYRELEARISQLVMPILDAYDGRQGTKVTLTGLSNDLAMVGASLRNEFPDLDVQSDRQRGWLAVSVPCGAVNVPVLEADMTVR